MEGFLKNESFSKDSITIKSLIKYIKTNKLSHAYLMVGEDGYIVDNSFYQFVNLFCLKNNKEFYNCGECQKLVKV